MMRLSGEVSTSFSVRAHISSQLLSGSQRSHDHAVRHACRCRMISTQPFDALCCHIGTAAIKHPMPDRVKPSFVIFDTRAL